MRSPAKVGGRASIVDLCMPELVLRNSEEDPVQTVVPLRYPRQLFPHCLAIVSFHAGLCYQPWISRLRIFLQNNQYKDTHPQRECTQTENVADAMAQRCRRFGKSRELPKEPPSGDHGKLVARVPNGCHLNRLLEVDTCGNSILYNVFLAGSKHVTKVAVHLFPSLPFPSLPFPSLHYSPCGIVHILKSLGNKHIQKRHFAPKKTTHSRAPPQYSLGKNIHYSIVCRFGTLFFYFFFFLLFSFFLLFFIFFHCFLFLFSFSFSFLGCSKSDFLASIASRFLLTFLLKTHFSAVLRVHL